MHDGHVAVVKAQGLKRGGQGVVAGGNGGCQNFLALPVFCIAYDFRETGQRSLVLEQGRIGPHPQIVCGAFFVGYANEIVAIAHAGHHGGHCAHGSDIPLVSGQGFCLRCARSKKHKLYGKGGVLEPALFFGIPHGETMQARLGAGTNHGFFFGNSGLRQQSSGQTCQQQ